LNPLKDISLDLQARLSEHIAKQQTIHIQAGNSKALQGFAVKSDAPIFDVSAHQGVVHYEPSELVVTARAGTKISDLNRILAEQGQMLACESPDFNQSASLGGSLATASSGPARPYTGAIRDFVLGVKMLNGQAEIVRFGGEVMKNVAGYDVSRLMAGSWGCLGVLLEISLKVLPLAEHTISLVFESDPQTAINTMLQCRRQGLPLSAASFIQGHLYLRFSGVEADLQLVSQQIGGEQLDSLKATQFWIDLREHDLAFFQQTDNLWRFSIPPATPADALAETTLIDWGGSQRWVYSDRPATELFALAEQLGGHAVLYRCTDPANRTDFMQFSSGLFALHQRLKKSFDPAGIFNLGRLHPDL